MEWELKILNFSRESLMPQINKSLYYMKASLLHIWPKPVRHFDIFSTWVHEMPSTSKHSKVVQVLYPRAKGTLQVARPIS